MIKNEIKENLIYGDAPPVANQQMNNINNNIQIKSNNEINFPSLPNINNINNPLNVNINNSQHNFGLNPILINNNIANPQMSINPLNKSIYEYNKMLYFNRLNYLYNSNNINERNNNNINNNNFNDYRKINQNIYNFKIDIKPDILKELKKEDLIDIIKFINEFCNLTIDSKNIRLKHEIFKIHKAKKDLKEYKLSLKKRIIKKILNQQNNNKEDEKEDNSENEESEENIKKDQKNENIDNEEKKDEIDENIFYCSYHKLKFENKGKFLNIILETIVLKMINAINVDIFFQVEKILEVINVIIIQRMIKSLIIIKISLIIQIILVIIK